MKSITEQIEDRKRITNLLDVFKFSIGKEKKTNQEAFYVAIRKYKIKYREIWSPYREEGGMHQEVKK